MLFGWAVYVVDWLSFCQFLASDWIVRNVRLIAVASLFALFTARN
jgi:hypothetical protein